MTNAYGDSSCVHFSPSFEKLLWTDKGTVHKHRPPFNPFFHKGIVYFLWSFVCFETHRDAKKHRAHNGLSVDSLEFPLKCWVSIVSMDSFLDFQYIYMRNFAKSVYLRCVMQNVVHFRLISRIFSMKIYFLHIIHETFLITNQTMKRSSIIGLLTCSTRSSR